MRGLRDERLRQLIRQLVRDLVAGRYAELAAASVSGPSSAEGLRGTIAAYPGTLVELPDEAFEWTDVYDYDAGGWRLEVPMYTAEWGQSDLTLILDAEVEGGAPVVRIRDLLVQ